MDELIHEFSTTYIILKYLLKFYGIKFLFKALLSITNLDVRRYMMNIKKRYKIFLVIFLITFYSLNIFLFQFKSLNSFAASPEISLNTDINKKILYLTFDDGPSTIVTTKILDILKKENVKATFFVVGYKINGREEILKRIYEEGHSIGLHTYTHKYKNIYASEEIFIDEMNKTCEEVKRVIGIDAKIIRFPSGSKKHLTNSLLEKLHTLDYKIYDWNLTLSDGIDYHTSVNKLFCEATQKCVNPNKIFLLMHCDQPNKNTCEVLEKIIKYYKDLNYEFRSITSSTPEYYFRICK